MIYAIISDIHANAEALKNVLEDAQSLGAQRIICLGDIVGYGPKPSETLELLLKHDATIIAGNHDDAVSGKVNESDFIDLARDAVLRHREDLKPNMREILASRAYTATFGEAIASHGDFTDPKNFLYIESEDDAAANFKAIKERLAFVGHTHTPQIFLTGNSGSVYKIEPQDFTIEDNKRYIVNPGSVGYPRENDGQCFSSYVIYDSEERSITFRFLPFSVSSVMQRGENPKRVKKWILALTGIILSIIAASLTWMMTPKNVDGSELFIKSEILELTPETRYISAHLILDTKAKSDPVDMEIKYLSSNDTEIDSKTITVRAYSKQFFQIPHETLSKANKVAITLSKQKRDDKVRIKDFSPKLSSTN